MLWINWCILRLEFVGQGIFKREPSKRADLAVVLRALQFFLSLFTSTRLQCLLTFGYPIAQGLGPRIIDLTCKRGSVGQSEGLSIPRSSVRFRLKPDNSNSHEFEHHRPSNKGTKLLLKVIKAIIIISCHL